MFTRPRRVLFWLESLASTADEVWYRSREAVVRPKLVAKSMSNTLHEKPRMSCGWSAQVPCCPDQVARCLKRQEGAWTLRTAGCSTG